MLTRRSLLLSVLALVACQGESRAPLTREEFERRRAAARFDRARFDAAVFA